MITHQNKTEKALQEQNPWWETGGLWQDPDLQKVKNSVLQYHPVPILLGECKAPGIMTLRGPRRAGKTVSLKLLISELIEKNIFNSQEIFWTTFENFRKLDQIEEHIESIIHSKIKPKVLVIDEATSVVGWQKILKKLHDQGKIRSVFIVLTGSSAFDLKAGAERMAGRRGDHPYPDRVLLPMSFSDFKKQWLNHFQLATDLEILEEFLSIGGFPLRVEKRISALKEDAPGDLFSNISVFDDVFFYEINRRRLERSIALELLGCLSAIGSAAMSYESLSKPLSVGRETLRRYLDALGDAFLIATISSYDTGRSRVAPKKDRKFVWIDPVFSFFTEQIKQGSRASQPTLVEWCVGVELLRRYEARLFEGLSAPRNVFTWKSSSGKELDYLIVDKSRNLRLPFEVKFQENISAWDHQVMEQAFKQGVLVTKNRTYMRKNSEAQSLEYFLQNP